MDIWKAENIQWHRSAINFFNFPIIIIDELWNAGVYNW